MTVYFERTLEKKTHTEAPKPKDNNVKRGATQFGGRKKKMYWLPLNSTLSLSFSQCKATLCVVYVWTKAYNFLRIKFWVSNVCAWRYRRQHPKKQSLIQVFDLKSQRIYFWLPLKPFWGYKTRTGTNKHSTTGILIRRKRHREKVSERKSFQVNVSFMCFQYGSRPCACARVRLPTLQFLLRIATLIIILKLSLIKLDKYTWTKLKWLTDARTHTLYTNYL